MLSTIWAGPMLAWLAAGQIKIKGDTMKRFCLPDRKKKVFKTKVVGQFCSFVRPKERNWFLSVIWNKSFMVGCLREISAQTYKGNSFMAAKINLLILLDYNRGRVCAMATKCFWKCNVIDALWYINLVIHKWDMAW